MGPQYPLWGGGRIPTHFLIWPRGPVFLQQAQHDSQIVVLPVACSVWFLGMPHMASRLCHCHWAQLGSWAALVAGQARLPSCTATMGPKLLPPAACSALLPGCATGPTQLRGHSNWWQNATLLLGGFKPSSLQKNIFSLSADGSHTLFILYRCRCFDKKRHGK